MMKQTMKWQKEGITLCSFEKGNAEKYYQDCFTDVDEEVMRLTGSKTKYQKKQVMDYYNCIVEEEDRYDFILINEDGKFIGESVINEIDWETRCANFRIVIFNQKNCSKGIGTWVVEKTRDFAFEQLKLHRLELDVYSFNPRAKRVYEKAGFQVEGIRKDAILDGLEYADDILMAILEKDWQKIKEI